MPSLESDYSQRCAVLKLRKAKLAKLGINPRSSKYLKLLYRRKP